MIRVQNLVKTFGSFTAVNDVSFDVAAGEIFAFLGPNGAGKTTTMKILTCYMPPTAGTVEVDGLNIFDHSLAVRRKIGYLPEMNPLYMDMNVLDYLAYSAELHGIRGNAARARIREMVRVCGLDTVQHKDIDELSKGFRQRVGLAQAMIHDPEVLIMDEPTSGLDPNQIVEIRNLIRQLGQAKTVVLSTHILPEVQATCDRVIIINDGKLVADGSPEQLQRQYQGGEELSLELKTGSADPLQVVAPRLRLLAYVRSVTLSRNELGTARFELAVDKGQDIREAVFRLAVSEGWVLLEMQRRITTLEEVFHKLTTA